MLHVSAQSVHEARVNGGTELVEFDNERMLDPINDELGTKDHANRCDSFEQLGIGQPIAGELVAMLREELDASEQ